MDELIVNQTLLLKRFPGKGGWTYAEVPNEQKAKGWAAGWVRVKGSIDEHEISDYCLAPLKNGRLLLPLKSELRKKMRKQAGDRIHVQLFRDDSQFEVPEEILECLMLEQAAYDRFLLLKDSAKRHLVKWIYSAKTEQTRSARINKLITKLLNGDHK